MPLLHYSLTRSYAVGDLPTAGYYTDPVFELNLNHNFVQQPLTLRSCTIVSNDTAAAVPGSGLARLHTATGDSHGILWLTYDTSEYLSARQCNTNVSDLNGIPLPCDYSVDRPRTQIYNGLDQEVNMHLSLIHI